MAYKYSTELKENNAKALGRSLPISTKHSVEVCSFIRGKNLHKAKALLGEVIAGRRPIPYKRYNSGLPHRKGIGPGRYPIKACEEILEILNSVEANAQFKGLGVNDLIIKHVSAKRGPTTMHFGRRRRKAKRTNIEIVVEEAKK